MIQITLKTWDYQKTFRAQGMNLGASLCAYELYKDYSAADGEFDAELMGRCIDFILQLFDWQFTETELREGYNGSAFTLFPEMLRAAIRYVEGELINFPEPASMPEERNARD